MRDNVEIAEYYMTHSGRETALHFGITRATVMYIARRYGIRKEMGGNVVHNRKEIADYYCSHTLKETCQQFQIAGGTVIKIGQEYNVQKHTDIHAVLQYLVGRTVKATAEHFGISTDTVTRYKRAFLFSDQYFAMAETKPKRHRYGIKSLYKD